MIHLGPCIHDSLSTQHYAEIARESPAIAALLRKEELVGKLRECAGLSACDSAAVELSNDQKVALLKTGDRTAKVLRLDGEDSARCMLEVECDEQILWLTMMESKSGLALLVGVEDTAGKSAVQIYMVNLESHLQAKSEDLLVRLPNRPIISSGMQAAPPTTFSVPDTLPRREIAGKNL